MHTLKIGPATYQVPETWNELPRKKLLRVLATLYGKPQWPRRHQLLADLAGCSVYSVLNLTEVQLAVLLPLTDWIFDDTQRLTAQLLPTVRLLVKSAGRRRLPVYATFHGPAARLTNLSFGEFIFADTYFVLYALGQDAGALDKLVATLYRPRRTGAGSNPDRADWCGDYREAFNEHLVERRAQQLCHLPDVEKLAIYTWYRGCRAQLEQDYPDVFGEAQDDTPAGGPPDWGRTLRKLSGEAFGTLQETAAEHARTVLAEMNDQVAEYQRQKAQAKQTTP